VQNTSPYIYIGLLSSATLVIAIAGILWLVRKEPGQRIFYRDLALVFFIAFYIPGAIFYFKRDLSVWWLTIPALMLALAFKKLFDAFSWKSVPLTRIDLVPTQPQRNGFKIVHLSDLHLCAAATTLEGGLARELVIETNREALIWAWQQAPDLIAITGDITDTGARAEWEIFESLLGELPPEWRNKIVFVPGNHDLTIQQRSYSSDNDGNALLDYDSRCLAFVRAYFSFMPPNAKMTLTRHQPTGSTEVDLEVLHATVSKPLDMYAQFSPRVQNTGEMMRGLSKSLTSAMSDRREDLEWRRGLSEYVPGIVIPEELRAIFGRDNELWPNNKYPLVQDLLHALYPLIVFENDRIVVVALNSNTVRSSWLADGALGELGALQLSFLELILNARPKDKIVAVLVHHHIGCPHDIQRQIARTMVELKALQMHEGPLLAGLLQRHGAPSIVLHGHKHAGYWAKANEITVMSAASVSYGNRLGGANCNAVLIDDKGEISLYASATISCAKTA
jgi:3',5'-cyclic AMP phosphodiesterase CpdA